MSVSVSSARYAPYRVENACRVAEAAEVVEGCDGPKRCDVGGEEGILDGALADTIDPVSTRDMDEVATYVGAVETKVLRGRQSDIPYTTRAVRGS